MSDKLILVGRFGAPHGVRGEIRVKSFTENPMALVRYAGLCDGSGLRRFSLTQARRLKDDLIVARVKDIATRDEAAALNGQEIFVPRSALPPTQDDEFYINDLIGLEARLADGSRFGKIVNVMNFGAGDVLEIDSGDPAPRLLPFTLKAVPHVDTVGGFVVVDPPTEIETRPDETSDAGL